MKDRTEDTAGGNPRLAEKLREQTAGAPVGYMATSPTRLPVSPRRL
ncbi:hypothetical protein J8F10_05695 [Gemmata sp. G18]|uniref:Uncharacterized protein n=1 Tax=Gemmata palustris TaxID=2822762 RepID=A0ABS5BM29_9BACT|nr:hypothetical protein [Gemmata palustris]MBP3954775.1 hypothetical protein [Gemmata palustris]